MVKLSTQKDFFFDTDNSGININLHVVKSYLGKRVSDNKDNPSITYRYFILKKAPKASPKFNFSERINFPIIRKTTSSTTKNSSSLTNSGWAAKDLVLFRAERISSRVLCLVSCQSKDDKFMYQQQGM